MELVAGGVFLVIRLAREAVVTLVEIPEIHQWRATIRFAGIH
jgi:hypothetical protein